MHAGNSAVRVSWIGRTEEMGWGSGVGRLLARPWYVLRRERYVAAAAGGRDVRKVASAGKARPGQAGPGEMHEIFDHYHLHRLLARLLGVSDYRHAPLHKREQVPGQGGGVGREQQCQRSHTLAGASCGQPVLTGRRG